MTADLSRALPLSERHVRYYILAARTIGLLLEDGKRPFVSERGVSLLATKPGSSEETDVFVCAIRESAPILACVGDYLAAAECDVSRLATRIADVTRLSESTALRRAECLVAWRLQLMGRGWLPSRDGKPLDFDELSVRARHAIENLQVRSLTELKFLTLARLEQSPNCGRKTVHEITRWAARQGVFINDDAMRTGLQIAEISDADPIPLVFLLELSLFGLSVRSSKAVDAFGIERVGDLALTNPESLHNLPNVGRRSIDELRDVLQSLGLGFGMRCRKWSSEVAKAESMRRSSELRQLENGIRATLFGVVPAGDLRSEVEAALTSKVCGQRGSRVALDWVGFASEEHICLEDVAGKHGITRERVRQIVTKVAKRVCERELPMKRLHTVVRHLEAREWTFSSELEATLHEAGHPVGAMTAASLMKAIELFAVTTPLELQTMGTERLLATRGGLEIVRAVQSEARRVASHSGCTTVGEVAARCSVDDASVLRILDACPGIAWLDRNTGWFWNRHSTRNTLRTRIDKVLCIASTIDVARLRAAIARDNRLDGIAPPASVLLTFCAQDDDYEVRDDQVSLRSGRELQNVLADNEETLVDVFKNFGPALTYNEARDRCYIAGMNENTTIVALNSSAIVARVAPAVYTLVGAKVSPTDVALALARVPRKTRVLDDHGISQDGNSVWMTYVLSESALANGVLTIPAAVRSLIVWPSYAITDGEGQTVAEATIVGDQVRGLLAYFRRRGGRVGDHARLCVNVERADATLMLSEEPFLT